MRTITLFLLFVFSGSFAQKIDFTHAPFNPIALQYKKEHFNLKGDVFAFGKRIFDKNGHLLFEKVFDNGVHYLYKNGLPYTNTEGKLFEFNSQGYLSKITYASLGVQSIQYTYNAKGLLTHEKGTKGIDVRYEYDDNNRLIKHYSNGNIREFSYQKNGDQLIITETNRNSSPEKITKHIYKNGRRIGENDRIFSLELDANGNPNNATLSAIYYKDIENQTNEISMVYTKPNLQSIDPLSDCDFFVNGKKVDFLFTKLLTFRGKDVMVYNPLTEKYYNIDHAISETKSGQKQVFSKVFINSPYFLISKKGTSLTLGYKGALLQNTVNGMRDGALKVYNSPVYLVYDKVLNQTFHGELTANNDKGYFPLQSISPNDNVVYLKSGENQYTIVIEGKVNAHENPSHHLYNANNGGSALVDDKNKPLYYLPATQTATINKLYAGRKFNPATDQILTKKSETVVQNSSSDSQKEVCLSGDCVNGFGKKKFANGETLECFFENGKANGVGTHKLVNGNSYLGNFKDDYYQGFGVYSWKNGSIYYGTWEKGLQHGYGYQLRNSKAEIAGYHTNGKLTIDLMTYNYQNNIYSGDCSGNCTDGFGQYKYSNGGWYYGFFKNGKPHHAGTFKNSKGDLYIGEFENNQMHGTGTLKYNSSGEFFVGQFTNGNFSGKGYKTDKNFNIVSTGNWQNGNHSNSTVKIEKPKPVNVSGKTLSPEAQAYFEVYNSNPDNLKKHLADLDKNWRNRKIEGDLLGQYYASLIAEIYRIEPQAAFELMMKMDKNATSATISKLPDDIRTYIRQKSRERVQQYTGSYSSKTN